MTKRKSQIIIRKSNKLVEAKYKLDIWETRVFTKALSMIKRDDVDFKEYRIYLTDMIKEFGLVKGLSYDFLKKGADSLNDRSIRIIRDTSQGKRVFKTKIVAGVDSAIDQSIPDALYIDISFHPKMKESLLALKSEFTTYDIRNVVSLPSTYSYRVYELLKQYEKIGARKFELKELKMIVGAIEVFDNSEQLKDHYPKYGNFKQRVLLKAQKDLAKYTDLLFTFEPVKRGRKVVEIIFYISTNKPNKKNISSPLLQELEQGNSIFDILFPKISTWNDIDEHSVKKLIDRYGEERVLAAYGQTKDDNETKKIKSLGKYFYNLVHNAPSLFDERNETIKNKEIKKNKIKEKEQQKSLIESEMNELKRQRTSMAQPIEQDIKIENPELVQAILDKIRSGSAFDRTLSDQENLERPMIKALISVRIKKMFPQRFEKVSLLGEQIEKLKKESYGY